MLAPMNFLVAGSIAVLVLLAATLIAAVRRRRASNAPSPGANGGTATTAATAPSQPSPGQAPAAGTWNLVATGRTTWHGFAEAIFAAAVARGLLPRAPRVLPITTADYPTPAQRPAYSCLDTSALRHDFRIGLPSWEQGLAGTIDELAVRSAA